MPALKNIVNGTIALFLLGFIGLSLFRLTLALGQHLHWF